MITINRNPQPFSFVYNPMVFDISSDKTIEDYFSYLIRLDIRGERIVQLKIPPRPISYNGVFDIQRFLQDASGYDLNNNITFSTCPNSFMTYSLTFDETYLERTTGQTFTENGEISYSGTTYSGHLLYFTASTTNIKDGDYIQIEFNPLGSSYSYLDELYSSRNYVLKSIPNYLILQSGSLVETKTHSISSQFYLSSLELSTFSTGVSFSADAYNGTIDYLDYLDYSYEDYMITSLTHSILSNIPNGFYMTPDDYLFLNFYQTIPNGLSIVNLYIKTNKGEFALINPTSQQHPDTNSEQRVLRCGCGPAQLLNGTASLFLISGSFPVIDDDTKEVELYTRDLVQQQTSTKLTYKIENKCSIYPKYTILFKDKLNSFCSYTFHLKSTKNNTYNRVRYKKRYMIEEYTNVVDAGDKIIDINKNTTYTLYSDYLTQTQYDYLMEIFESSAVFLLKNDKWVSINILNGGVEHQQTINGDLLYITIEFELSYREENQRT